MELNPSLIEITGEDDSLLHEIPTLDDPTTAATATNYYFTCSPLQIPGPSRNADRTRVSPIKGLNDNMDVEKPTCSSVVGSSNKENINVDKSVAPKLCVEPQQIKRRKRGGTYNLRKSLAWDRAFFTEEGVLNPLELSILSGNFGSCCRETLPTIHEEGRKFYSNSGGTSDLANLQLHGEKLVKEILVPSSSKRENTSSLLMNHVSPARDNLAPTSMGTPKMLSNHKGSRTWSKSGGCPRPLGFPSFKRPATASTTKSAMKGSKLSKIPVSRSGAHSLPKSNKSNVLSSSHSEHNQIGQADIFQKIAGLQGSIKNSKSSPSKSKACSDSLSMTAKSSVQHSRRNIANLALEVHSSTNPQPTLVTKANCGLEMFAAAVCPPVGPPVPDAHDLSTTTGSLLSHDTHFINGNMQCKQLQTIRPSGLRMPSPSLGFFVQPKSSSSNSSSPKAAQPSNIPGSSIPSLQRHKALNSTINPRWRLHAPAKMQKMDNNPTVSGNSMVSGSSTECSVPCVGNDSSHDNGKLKLEGNNLLIVEELIPCYSKRSEPRENQEVDSIVAGDEVFQECGEPHKIYRSSKDDSDSNNEVNIVCPDYRDPSRNDLENTDKTEQINASGEGYQICQRKNHNRTNNDGILLEERKLFECQKYESENVANVNSNGFCSEGSEKLSLNSPPSKITEHAYKCAAGVDQLSGNLHVEDLEVLFLDKTSLAKSCDNKLHTSEMYDQILVVDDDNVTSGEPSKPQSRCLLVEQSSQFLSDDDYSLLSKSTCAEESHGDLGAIQEGDADVYEMVDQQQVKASLSSSAEGVSLVEIHNCYVDKHFGRDLSMKKSGDHMDDDLNTCKSMAFCSLSKEDEMGANGLKNDILAEKAETKVSSDSPHEVNERIKINCGILVGESISFDEFDTGDLGNTADVGLINQGSIGIESKSRKIASLFEYHKSSIDTDFGNDMVFSGQTSFTKSDSALVLSDNQNFGVITNCKANCLDEESSFPVQKVQILANETNVVHLGVDNINTILPDDPEISISQTDISPTGELQHKLDNGISLVEDDDTTVPVSKKGEDGGKQNNLTVRPPINAVPFSDEWLAAMEAAGEEILTIKSGAVQNSPTDKSLTEPGPWSPVKRKQNQIGPFDCTKFNIPPPDSI